MAIHSNMAICAPKAGPSDLGLRKKLLMTSVIFKVSAGMKLLLPAKVLEAALQGSKLGQEMADRQIDRIRDLEI